MSADVVYSCLLYKLMMKCSIMDDASAGAEDGQLCVSK